MAAHQAPLSLGFSRQECWSGLPFPSQMHACRLSRFSRVRFCATPWTAAHQAPLSMGFSRQEYWSGLPFPSPNIQPTILKMDTQQGHNCYSTGKELCSIFFNNLHGKRIWKRLNICITESLCCTSETTLLIVTPWTVPARLLCPWNFPGRILEWVAISFSRGSSQLRGQTGVSCIGRWIFYHWATWEAPNQLYFNIKLKNLKMWLKQKGTYQGELILAWNKSSIHLLIWGLGLAEVEILRLARKVFKCKTRNYKTPRGEHGQNTLLHESQQDPLWPTSQNMEIKAKINKWDLMKLKSFCTTKETISKVERQPSDW